MFMQADMPGMAYSDVILSRRGGPPAAPWPRQMEVAGVNMCNTAWAGRCRPVIMILVSATWASVAWGSWPAAGAPTVTVQYSDLNLSSRAGVKALHRRIEFAARAVCGDTNSHQIAAFARFRECYRRAVQDAVNQVPSSELARLQRDRL